MTLAAFLNLRGEAALVVGGGAVALRRTRTLLDAGLRVTVVAPELRPEFAALPVTPVCRAYHPADVAGARVVVAATNSPAVNDAVTRDARAAGALVNHAGDAGQGSLRFPAVAARGGLRVAIHTGLELPLLAAALRERVLALLPAPEAVDAWAERREEVVRLPAAERAPALGALRADIRAALGLPALGDAL